MAQEDPKVVRLRDAVGDTISLAERDSFRLFPNTAGFRYAVLLGLPGSQFVAMVAQADGDTMMPVYYRVLPGQLKRIRFLIDYRDFAATQCESDSGAAQTLAAFWQTIEGQPLTSMESTPTGVVTAAGPCPRLVTAEHRLGYTMHGATCGSVVGGCVGARTSYTVVEPAHYEATICGPIYFPPVYSVDLTTLMATSIGMTAAGAVAGYVLGAHEDQRPVPVRAAEESDRHRNGLAAASLLPAIAVGLLVGTIAHGTLFGRESSYRLNDDPNGLSVIPAVLAGVCVSVDIVALCYQVGRSIDRDEAEQAERRNRSLGH
jgi:hypothetical protein